MALILIADDEADVRASVETALSPDGHEFIHTENGWQCEREIARRRPDLVIIDVVMPERDGLETIRALRRAHPGLKILAISGGGEGRFGGSLHFAQEFGATAVLGKPIDVARLRELVGTLLAPVKG